MNLKLRSVHPGGNDLWALDRVRPVSLFCDSNGDNRTVLRARRPRVSCWHIRQEVAQAEHNPVAVDLLDRLQHVSVVADNEVDGPGRGDLLGDVALIRRHRGIPFNAPMQADDHHLRAVGTCTLSCSDDVVRINQVRPPRLASRKPSAVETEGKAEMGHQDSVDIEGAHDGFIGSPRHPRLPQTSSFQCVDGCIDACGTTVHRVVARRAAAVVTGGFQRRRDFGWHAVYRERCEPFTRGRYWCFQVANCHVGPRNDRRYTFEHRRKVEAASTSVQTSPFDKRRMQQRVAREGKRRSFQGR